MGSTIAMGLSILVSAICVVCVAHLDPNTSEKEEQTRGNSFIERCRRQLSMQHMDGPMEMT